MHRNKRVLIIEDDPEYARLATMVLAGSDSSFEINTAATLAGGLDASARFAPDVIVLDLDLPDSSGYDTFLRVRGQVAGVPIVVLTGLDDDQTALKTAENGAQDYLVKGSQQPKFIARCVNMALRRQALVGAPRVPTQVIGCIGSKGGVGTSTIAANTAAHLAQSGGDTLIIEFQPGPGTLFTYLPAKPAYGLNSLLEIPPAKLTDTDLQHGLMEAGPGLRILCPGASRGPSVYANADFAQVILSAARRMCTYVVLDLPPRVDDGVAAALRLCDSIAVIVDRETSSVCAAVDILEQIKAAGPEESRVRLVAVNRTSPEVPVALADIFTRLKMHPVFVVPNAASSVALSQSAKVPLAWLCPEDRFSVATLELTEQLIASSSGSPAKATTQRRTLNRRTSHPLVSDAYIG
jgi:MinD-like ATPase involved in chromosome partitioning or flagellar assembly/CheY-like chemotaxis protein